MKTQSIWRLSVGKKGIALALALAILFGIASFALFPRQAQAASWGCEHNPVGIDGFISYAYMTTAWPCLRTRDLLSFAIEGCLPYHTTISVDGQFTFPNHMAAGSDIWDLIRGGYIVSDAYVNTSHFNAPSPPIPSCEIIGGPGWIGGSCS